MRGKGHTAIFQIKTDGITPAYAGKSFQIKTDVHRRWDHPRLCGEKTIGKEVWKMALGSPPPMRGKAVPRRQNETIIGITPAYAGKSFRDIPPTHDENGSPPPMRGKANAFLLRACMSGITPAYAGKSRRSNCCFKRSRDHPRLCGEKKFSVNSAFRCAGSPPPMRGKD